MKNDKRLMLLLIVMLVFGFMLTGCEPQEDTYEVWVKTFNVMPDSPTDPFFGISHNEFKALSQTKAEFEWEREHNFKGSPYIWNKNGMVGYLVEKGFSEEIANNAADFFLKYEHAIFGIRINDELINFLQ